MKKEYSAMFEKLAPPKSDSELLRAVLDRKAERPMRKKLNKKAILMPAAALGVLCVTTVGVSAAVNWDLPSAINSLFTKKLPESTGNRAFEFNDYDIGSIGSKKLDDRFVRDGYTIQFIGVVADKHTSFLLYDVIVDEGHVFKNEDSEYTLTDTDTASVLIWSPYENQEMFIDDMLANQQRDITKFSETNLPRVMSREGNIFHCADRYDVTGVSLENKRLTFDIRDIQLRKADGSYAFQETNNVLDKLTIDYDFINESSELLLENEPFNMNGETYSLLTADLTSLSLDLRVEWETGYSLDGISERLMKRYNEFRENAVRVRFKDGSLTDNGALSWNKYDGENVYEVSGSIYSDFHFMWNYPVNISDIDALIIGDTEIKIN